MYKNLMALVIVIGVLAWLYVTLKINGLFDMNEGFISNEIVGKIGVGKKKRDTLTDFGIPSMDDLKTSSSDISNDYMTKLRSDLQLLGKQAGKNDTNVNSGIKPVVDTLRDFVMERAAKSPHGMSLLKNIPKGVLEGYKDILGQDNLASTAEIIPKNKDVKTNIPIDRPIALGGPKCRFTSSYSDTYSCPDKYPSHMGATFGAKVSSGLTCNGEKIKADRAKAYAVVRNGEISKIKIIHKGNNYLNPPRVKIIGKGNGARARAVLTSEGTVHAIRILHPGSGYTSSPKIIMGVPDAYMYCHLCCSIPQG